MALSGTILNSTVESDIIVGGKIIILTANNDIWVASAGGLFDNQRQNIINGMTSNGSEIRGWNNEVRV